jgi:hypothetical protein
MSAALRPNFDALEHFSDSLTHESHPELPHIRQKIWRPAADSPIYNSKQVFSI